jgi:hypothetical protein
LLFVSVGARIRRIDCSGVSPAFTEKKQEGTIYRAPTFGGRLKLGQVFVEMGYSFDAAVVVFEGEMLVGSVGVFVG